MKPRLMTVNSADIQATVADLKEKIRAAREAKKALSDKLRAAQRELRHLKSEDDRRQEEALRQSLRK